MPISEGNILVVDDGWNWVGHSEVHAMSRIILIACSARKNKNGHPWPDGDSHKGLAAMYSSLLEKRREVTKVVPNLRKRGAGRYPNEIVNGPDLGGAERSGRYLYAIERYNGGFFQQFEATDALKHLTSEAMAKTEVLVVSGLYGLLWPRDLIQDYDVDLADVYVDQGTLRFLDDYWRETITTVLDLRVKEHLEADGNNSVEIYDLLVNELYQDAIDWERIRENQNCEVKHRFLTPDQKRPVQKCSGDEARDAWGRAFIELITPVESVKSCKFGALEQNPAKEAVSEHKDWLINTLFNGKDPGEKIIESFANSFMVLEKCRSARSFNYAAACQGLWSGLELFLREKVGRFVENSDGARRKILGKEKCREGQRCLNNPRPSCLLHNLKGNRAALRGEGEGQFKPGLGHFLRIFRYLGINSIRPLWEINDSRGGGSHGANLEKDAFKEQFKKVKTVITAVLALPVPEN